MGYIALGDLISKAQVEKCGKREYPVLSMTMHDGIVFQNDRFKKDIASIDRSNYSVVGFNQLVVSFPIDEGVLAVQDITDAGIVSPAYKIWDIDQAKLVPKYLEMWLRSPRSIDYYKSKLRGTTARRRSIPEEDFLGMRVNVLPMEEQERIVDLITRVNGVILLRKQQLSALDDLIKARFVEMFGECRESISAGDLMHNMRNGVSPSTSGKHQEKVLTLSAITQGQFDPNMWKDGIFDAIPAADKRICSTDFYMCRGNGNKSLVGAGVYSADDRDDLVFPDTVIAASVDTTRVCLPYLFVAWMQPGIREQIEAGARTTNGTYKINQQIISKIKVPLPPLPEQQQFATFVAQIDKSKSVIQKSLDETQLLFDSLMQQYFG